MQASRRYSAVVLLLSFVLGGVGMPVLHQVQHAASGAMSRLGTASFVADDHAGDGHADLASLPAEGCLHQAHSSQDLPSCTLCPRVGPMMEAVALHISLQYLMRPAGDVHVLRPAGPAVAHPAIRGPPLG